MELCDGAKEPLFTLDQSLSAELEKGEKKGEKKEGSKRQPLFMPY